MVKGVEIDTVKRIRGGGGFKSEPKKRKSQKEVQKNFYKTASPLRFSSLFLIFQEKAKKKVKRSFSKICADLRSIVHTATIRRILCSRADGAADGYCTKPCRSDGGSCGACQKVLGGKSTMKIERREQGGRIPNGDTEKVHER